MHLFHFNYVYIGHVTRVLHNSCTVHALHVQCMHYMYNACMKLIDPVCGRHTAVLKSSKVLFTLSNGPDKPEVMILPRHKKFEGAGKKATTKTKVSVCRHFSPDLDLWK